MTASASPEREDLAEKLASHYAELVGVLQRTAAEDLGRAPKEGEWTPLQQIEHQLMAEDIWTKMAARACAEDEPDLAQLWATYRKVEESNPFPPPSEPRSLEQLLDALRKRHEDTMRLLEATPDTALARAGRNTGFGNLTVLQMFRGVYRHYRMHIDQIEGREPSFQPRRAQ
ncbi:MAG TPA: DinB family protein [Dehalococcoidia bacterium]